MRALAIVASKNPAIVYVQNLVTLAIHGLRAGDATATICGWHLGPKVFKKGTVDSVTPIGVCWEMLFERCLMPERQAAKAVEVNAIDQIDTTPAKDSLAA